MKARIEELAEKTTSQISGLLGDDTESIVRAALLTLAEECYEGAAKVCDRYEDDWIGVAQSEETVEASNHYTALASGAGVCACSVRAMKGELK